MKILLFLSLYLMFTQVGNGQFNLQVGYCYSYSKHTTQNAIFSDFNTRNKQLTQSFPSIRGMHGLSLGGNYTYQAFSTGMMWSYFPKRIEGAIFDSTNLRTHHLGLHYNIQTFSYLMELNWVYLGFGASIDYNHTLIKHKTTPVEEKIKLLSDWNTSASLFINLNIVRSDIMGIVIRPFYVLPLNSVNFSNLQEHLQTQTSSLESTSPSYGIKVIFNNGPQSQH